MTSKKLCYIARGAIIAIAFCGLCICVFWFPFYSGLSGSVNPYPMQVPAAIAWSMLIFSWVASLPCFFILIIAWKVTKAIKEEKIFTKEVANQLNLCAKVLFIDLSAFLLGNIVFAIIEFNAFAILYFFMIIIGIVVSVFISVLAHYVAKAAELREESEATI